MGSMSTSTFLDGWGGGRPGVSDTLAPSVTIGRFHKAPAVDLRTGHEEPHARERNEW